MKRKKITSIVLAFALVFALIPAFGVTVYADTNVKNIAELKNALAAAQEGDIINVVDVVGFLNLDEGLVIPAGVTVKIGADVWFYLNSALVNRGTLINGGVLTVNDTGSMENSGMMENNGSIYINDRGKITNSGTLLNKNNIINNAVFENKGLLNNEGYITNGASLYNSGRINSSWMMNNGTIINNGELNTSFMLNYDLIENYGTINNTGHWDGSPAVEMKTFLRAEAAAYVEKLNGNKNLLVITVTEYYSNKGPVKITKEFMIDNNSAGTYTVGEYKVYVNTKGNIQIRDIYII